MVESFLEAGVREEVAELCIHLVAVGESPGGNFLGDRLECGQVGGGIAVAPGVICDDCDALAEVGDEGLGHGNA